MKTQGLRIRAGSFQPEGSEVGKFLRSGQSCIYCEPSCGESVLLLSASRPEIARAKECDDIEIKIHLRVDAETGETRTLTATPFLNISGELKQTPAVLDGPGKSVCHLVNLDGPPVIKAQMEEAYPEGKRLVCPERLCRLETDRLICVPVNGDPGGQFLFRLHVRPL
ncbi:MAG: hypothetical protein A4E57_04837 [Syntrophorhabdaceae bacterium PtaU1.Bin034]|nr:MAG: hypothetical protein A4E57_04837 [Syntrophorhabdaceae bacterium PtaU1.Bin034]